MRKIPSKNDVDGGERSVINNERCKEWESVGNQNKVSKRNKLYPCVAVKIECSVQICVQNCYALSGCHGQCLVESETNNALIRGVVG